MNKNISYTVLLSLILVGAQLAYKKYQFNQLEKETMQIHDDAMRDMAEMNRLARSIKKELSLADTLPLRPTRRDSLESVLKSMVDAENDMMDWMKNYEAKPPLLPLKNDLEMLEQQKTKIEKNFFDIKSARDAGKLLAQ